MKIAISITPTKVKKNLANKIFGKIRNQHTHTMCIVQGYEYKHDQYFFSLLYTYTYMQLVPLPVEEALSHVTYETN